jgi:hypothetical protein
MELEQEEVGGRSRRAMGNKKKNSAHGRWTCTDRKHRHTQTHTDHTHCSPCCGESQTVPLYPPRRRLRLEKRTLTLSCTLPLAVTLTLTHSHSLTFSLSLLLWSIIPINCLSVSIPPPSPPPSLPSLPPSLPPSPHRGVENLDQVVEKLFKSLSSLFHYTFGTAHSLVSIRSILTRVCLRQA